MNPLVLILVQFLQALGIMNVIQNFIIAMFGLILVFAALNYFRGR